MYGGLLFAAGAFFGPIFGTWGSLVGTWLTSKSPEDGVVIDACSPLKDARVIFSTGGNDDAVVGSQPISFLNETSTYLKNASGNSLTNVSIAVLPLSPRGRDKEIKALFTQAYANSVFFADSIKMNRVKQGYTINIEKWNSGESILKYTHYNEPIDQFVEIRSDQITLRKHLPAGCDQGIYESTLLPAEFFLEFSDECKKPETLEKGFECKVESG